MAESRETADAIYRQLVARLGEGSPERRLSATRRAVELLGDPHRAYPIIHVTGTNGKTSTSRMIESILRAHNLTTGLFTSPHLVRFNERIVIDGRPISDAALVRNWEDIAPYIAMIDKELQNEGQQRLTFFEVMTVLGFACFADAAVDVAVIEVGMGGEWDSTNVADGRVAVLTPISLDHTAILGGTVGEIAHTKSGIIKPDARVVSASQPDEALRQIRAASESACARLAVQQVDFGVTADVVGVGGQLIAIHGLAADYDDVFLPLFGAHQAQNLAVAVAAVESFLGDGRQPIARELLVAGAAATTSPGRLQVIATEPTVLVDAAHNPGGASTLAAALDDYFHFDDVTVVFGVMADKDVHGIIDHIGRHGDRFFVTQSHSSRALAHDVLARELAERLGTERVNEFDELEDALASARRWAGAEPGRAVIVTGSIALVGETLAIADDHGWLREKTAVS